MLKIKIVSITIYHLTPKKEPILDTYFFVKKRLTFVVSIYLTGNIVKLKYLHF